MEWKLNKVNIVECTLDNSGIYVVINRITVKAHSKGYNGSYEQIRLDIMSSDDEPLQSFQGPGNAVRKAAIKWIWDNKPIVYGNGISTEHASYTGFEIARAMSNSNYVQD